MKRGTVLTTRRLRLRTWRRSDMRPYDKHCNTPEVMAWLGGVMTPQELRQDYHYFARQQRRNGFTFWVVERKSDRAFLGFCGIVRIDEPTSTVFGEVEIGWRLRSDMWRRGYAFEAADRVLVYAFEYICPNRIVSRVAARNRPSQALMRKLGMRRRPKLDYVHAYDQTRLRVYVITRKSWLKSFLS
jgi:RimJ/RimL family protein N-acetyltransferase